MCALPIGWTKFDQRHLVSIWVPVLCLDKIAMLTHLTQHELYCIFNSILTTQLTSCSAEPPTLFNFLYRVWDLFLWAIWDPVSQFKYLWGVLYFQDLSIKRNRSQGFLPPLTDSGQSFVELRKNLSVPSTIVAITIFNTNYFYKPYCHIWLSFKHTFYSFYRRVGGCLPKTI